MKREGHGFAVLQLGGEQALLYSFSPAYSFPPQNLRKSPLTVTVR